VTVLDGYMLRSLGLGGDGDEVDAIERVEATFGVAFASEHCERFITVGDVWKALRGQLSLGEQEAAPLWNRFVALLGEETLSEDELREIGPETLLLAAPLTETVKEALRRMRRT